MPGITIYLAQKKLETWLAAEDAVATGQSYTIGTRSLTRANLVDIQKQIEYWNRTLIRLEEAASTGRSAGLRVRAGVPIDG